MLLFAFAILAATVAHGGWLESDCQEFADRSVTVPADGVSRVIVLGQAGSLHVEGRSGVGEIRATGRACAPIEELLVGMRLTASRSGSEVTITAEVPRHQEGGRIAAAPRLDFTVVVPAAVAVEIGDTTGALTISGVGPAKVGKRAGSIRAADLTGGLDILDQAGEIHISDVRENVHVSSRSSGVLVIERVGGSVKVDEHRTGRMDVRRVQGGVEIGTAGSSSVFVSDVGGDFIVRSKGRAELHYKRVAGRVTIH